MAERNSINYNSMKYDIQDLEYPTDLGADDYGNHRVVFLINVADESKFRAPPGSTTDVYDIPSGEISSRAAEKVGQSLQGSAEKLENFVKEKSDGSINVDLRPTAFNKRLKAAISLYVPNDLTFSYAASWSDEELPTSENIASAFNAMIDGNAGGVVNAGIRSMLNNYRNMAAVQSLSNQTPGNAKVEQLFRGVDFRTFTFNYDFAPRDENEATNVMNIISMFRHHMLPEFKDNDQFLFIYPSQFEIKYYKGDAENEYLDKHFTAVCTNCSINYTASGQFSTFANGMPTHIRMNLTFKEIAIPTKETTPFMFGQKSYSDQRKELKKTISDRASNPIPGRIRGGE